MTDIPKDIMDAARRQCDLHGVTTHSDIRPFCEQITAQAILAERERCAKAAEGWPTEAAGDKYQTDGNSFWDAGSVYDQGRIDAAVAIRRGAPC